MGGRPGGLGIWISRVTDRLVDDPPQIVPDLQRRLDESLAQQAATAELLKLISRSTFDLQTVLETLVQSAVKLCGANRGAIFLREGDVFPLRAASSSTPEFLQYWAANPPRAGRGSATARVIASGKIEAIFDALADPEMEMPANSLKNIRGTLGVPMLRDSRVEGVLVLTRPEPGPFARNQIDLVQTFADQAVIAIENTRLFEQVQAKTLDLEESLQQQTATADVLKVISRSAFDLQAVLDTLVTSAAQLCDANSGIIWLRRDDLFHAGAATGFSAEEMSFFRDHPRSIHDKSLAPRVLRSRQAEHIPDRSLDPEFAFPGMPGLPSSMLGVPLLRNDGVEGVFTLGRVNVAPFTPRQIDLVESFADQAVIAIENARLFNESKEALERQTATADILKVIASSPSDVEPVFEAIAASANRLIGGFSATVMLFVNDALNLVAFTRTNAAADQALQASFPRPLAEFPPFELVRGGETVVFPDTEAENVPRLNRELARLRGYRSMVFAPLMSNGAPVGILSVTRVRPGTFPTHHVQLLRTFADQAVIAIENARLFEEVQQRTNELARSLDDLRTAQDRLVQTEKLASLGQLTAGIAHEIKNPLNFVNNFSSLSAELIDELDETLASASLDQKMRDAVSELTQMLKSNLEKVVQHGKRADSIVKNMLLHSREGSGEHRSADVNAIVEDSLNLAYHGARAEKSDLAITLRPDFDPDAGTAELYPQEITRALLNLISNGLYAATRRKVESGDQSFEPLLTASTRNLGKTVEIRIRDNGTGIPPEVREKMFNPFFTTKPTGEGTGLGLSMTHDIIVKQHGGRIEVETEPGSFTEIIVTLPRAPGPAAASKRE